MEKIKKLIGLLDAKGEFQDTEIINLSYKCKSENNNCNCDCDCNCVCDAPGGGGPITI